MNGIEFGGLGFDEFSGSYRQAITSTTHLNAKLRSIHTLARTSRPAQIHLLE